MAPCPSHSRVRVCQEPFPPRPETHRPRYPSKQPPESEVGGVSVPMRSTCHGRLVIHSFYTSRCQRCDDENNESSSAVPGWTNTHCVLSYKRKGSSPENAGSVKLMNVLKLDVAEKSPPVTDGSQSCAANVSSKAPMAAPHQDAMPHIRFRLVA